MQTLAASQRFKNTPAGRIPVDWQCVRIQDVGEVQAGKQLSAQTAEGTPRVYLRVANVLKGFIDTSDVFKMKMTDSEFERFRLRRGDVLLNEGQSLELVGRSAIYQDEPPLCAFQNSLIKFRPGDRIRSDFAHQLFEFLRLSGGFAAVAAQTTSIAHLGSERFAKIQIPLPPISEQERIEEILRASDDGISSAEQLAAAKLDHKRGLMQQLLTGRRGFKKGVSWIEVPLGDIFRERAEIGFNDLPLLAITSDRGVVPRDDLVKRDTSNPDKSKYLRILPGDIGYNTMRMWQGVSALSSHEGIVSPAYTVITPTDRIDGLFASYLLKYPPVIHVLGRYSQGIVDDTLNLKFEAFSKIRLRIPDSLIEQRRIASLLQHCDKEIALLEDQAEAIGDQKRGLMQLLLTGQRRLRTS